MIPGTKSQLCFINLQAIWADMLKVYQVAGTLQSSGDSHSEKGLVQSVNAAQELFRIAIRSTAPDFQPFEKKDAQSQLPLPHFLRLEEGDREWRRGWRSR